MRVIVFTFLFIFVFNQGKTQIFDDFANISHSNGWIDYDKTYFKIPVAEDGVYRITYTQLIESGIDLNDIQGKDFLLFLYGEEVSIYTTTEGYFSSSDYLEFYGKKNRSEIDYYLFESKSFLFNPEYSLFNDTAAYFLTWDKSTVNKRFEQINNDLNGNLPEAESFYIHEEKLVLHDNFNKPLRNVSNHLYKSNFDIGEGFGSVQQVKNVFTLNTSYVVNSNVQPELTVRYTTNLGKHNIDFEVNGVLKKNEIRYSLFCGETDIDLNPEDLTEQITISLEGKNNNDFKDKNSVSVIKLKYSREFNFLNKSFFKFGIEPSADAKYIEIQNFDIIGSSFVLYDVINSTRQNPIIENNLVKFLLPPSDVFRNFVLINLDKNTKLVNDLNKCHFVDYSKFIDKNYIIITDKNRFVDSDNINWVEEYSKYRSSVAGGSYKTLIADIHDIYNQFGFGIDRHNIALNNFILYVNEFFTNPEYIFIIGKGLEYNEIRTEAQLNDSKDIFYVPTFGFPGSDNLLASKFKKNYPELAIGRLAAKNHFQIASYLDKIKRHENYLQYPQTIKGKEWMKKVIHLVGGTSNIFEQIDYNLQEMGKILHNNKFGGEIHTFRRTGGSAQESVTKRILDDINEGAGIVTFYGHSGITGTDFNITNLKNDKHPVFYSLGCYSGNIHTKIEHGQSEEFVLDTSGVIAYIGTSGTGFTGSLAKLGEKIYEYTGKLYGEGIGKIVQRAIKYTGEKEFDIGTVTLNQQFTFHGDPAVTLYKHPGPDYLIDINTIQTDSDLINTTDEFLEIGFDIVNLGFAIEDSLQIKIIREFPNGDEDTTFHKVKSIKSRRNVSIKLKTFEINSLGENCISISLDPNNSIDELPLPEAEDNNKLSDDSGEFKTCFEIVNTKARPISPNNFGIVNDKNVELKVSTLNYFIAEHNYVFQIDTTELFNSPNLKETTISSFGGVISWKPDFELQNETVYYWRVSPNGINWENSSFVYVENSSKGWNQSHYFQYLHDDFNNMTFSGRNLDFERKKYNIKVIGKKYIPTNRKVFFVDGEGWGGLNTHIRPSIVITAWGPKNWYRNKSDHDFNSLPNSYKYSLQFVYDPRIVEHRQGIRELLDAIPDSMTVFIYTVLGDETQSIEPENWAQDSIIDGTNLFNVLEGYGAKKVRLLESRGTVPYVFIFKKGEGALQEQIGDNINSVFELNQEVTINSASGLLTSKPIGPATNWSRLIWSEEITGDTTEYSYLIVHKLNEDQTEDIIIDTLRNEYELDLTGIDAEKFPFIQLDYFAYDRLKRDPPNMNFWRVYYNGYPDAVLSGENHSLSTMDTIKYGEDFTFDASIFNDSPIDMDSILVKYKITNGENDIVIYKRYAPLKSFSTNEINFEYPTGDLQGDNIFSVVINAGKEQKEKNYFNNTGIKNFFVKSSTKSMDPLQENTDIIVYPNPFQNRFTIEAFFKESNNLIKLINTSGKIIYTTTKMRGKQIFEIAKQEIKNGVYFLEISNNKNIFIYKIIKLTY